MIKAVIFDIDNTLMDFMRMKRAAVDAAVDAMLDAGLPMKKEKMYESIFETYWKDGIEYQNIFDKVLLKEFGHVDYRILAAGIIGYLGGRFYPGVFASHAETVGFLHPFAASEFPPRFCFCAAKVIAEENFRFSAQRAVCLGK